MPYLLNNLACAQWWHFVKFRGVSWWSRNPEKKQALSDYTQCVPNLQRAISLFTSSASPYRLSDPVPTSPLCGIPLCNIGEILVEAGKEEGLQWWKRVVEYYNAHDKSQLPRVYIHLAGLLQFEDKKRAEDLVDTAKKALGKRENVIMAFALETQLKIMGRDNQRKEEAEGLVKRLEEVNEKLVAWQWPMEHLFVPQWSVI